MHDRIAHLLKHNRIAQLLYRYILSAVFRIIGIFISIHEKQVLFSSYGGKQYSDSPKVLFEGMKSDPRFSAYNYVWAFENPERFDVEGTEKVKIDTISYFVAALQSRIWITNVNIERGLHFKKKATLYLNTWHGTGPKKSGNAIQGRNDYDFSYVDILCCDGEYLKNIFLTSFKAKEESMLWCGRPREDELLKFTELDRKAIRNKLNIPDDKRMILYMPTWREKNNRGLDFARWEAALGDNYVIGVRAHHFSADTFNFKGQTNFWMDLTGFPNVNELYCAADILISDYSSAFFDYGLLGKPMLCYAYDYEIYEETVGFYMDLKREFPGGVKKTEQEVINAILAMDYEEECKRAKAFCARFVRHPGDATRECLDAICKRLPPPM